MLTTPLSLSQPFLPPPSSILPDLHPSPSILSNLHPPSLLSDLHSSPSILQDLNTPPHHRDKREGIAPENVYGFFSSQQVQADFITRSTVEFLWSVFQVLASHKIWQAIRGEERVTSDPDIPGVLSWLTGYEIGFNDVIIGFGYGLSGILVNMFLPVLLGGQPPKSLERTADERQGGLDWKNDKKGDLLETLDSLFGWDRSIIFILVHIKTILIKVIFWMWAALLPELTSL